MMDKLPEEAIVLLNRNRTLKLVEHAFEEGEIGKVERAIFISMLNKYGAVYDVVEKGEQND